MKTNNQNVNLILCLPKNNKVNLSVEITFCEIDQDNHIIIEHYTDDKNLVLYYKGDLNEETIFIVELIDSETNERIYHDYFSDMKNAHADFMRLFYSINIVQSRKAISALNNYIQSFNEYFKTLNMEEHNEK